MERLSPPTSKWWVSTLTITLTILAVLVAELQTEGVEVPYILGVIGLAAGRIATYLKTENRPSPSARAAVERSSSTASQPTT